MKFSELNNGDVFKFEKSDVAYTEMDGPWRKVSARKYVAGPGNSYLYSCTVGSVTAKVELIQKHESEPLGIFRSVTL